MKETFFLRKMKHSAQAEPSGQAHKMSYQLGPFTLSDLIGAKIIIEFTPRIQCVHCGRSIKKTFGDGYCFPCFQKLAACDICILKPELCHFAMGTCREPEWGKQNCLIPHIVYLANTSGLKVGITRQHKCFERWGDQGAWEALPLAVVPERYIAGLVEVQLAKSLSDKSDWRALVTGRQFEVDLRFEADKIKQVFPTDFSKFIVATPDLDNVHKFDYPILRYPNKAVTYQIAKQPKIEGVLEGVRGQYIFIEGKVINIRKYSGYEVTVEI